MNKHLMMLQKLHGQLNWMASRQVLREATVQDILDVNRVVLRGFEQQMRQLTGGRTVPQIIIDGKPIGGYNELVELDMDGGL